MDSQDSWADECEFNMNVSGVLKTFRGQPAVAALEGRFVAAEMMAAAADVVKNDGCCN